MNGFFLGMSAGIFISHWILLPIFFKSHDYADGFSRGIIMAAAFLVLSVVFGKNNKGG